MPFFEPKATDSEVRFNKSKSIRSSPGFSDLKGLGDLIGGVGQAVTGAVKASAVSAGIDRDNAAAAAAAASAAAGENGLEPVSAGGFAVEAVEGAGIIPGRDVVDPETQAAEVSPEVASLAEDAKRVKASIEAGGMTRQQGEDQLSAKMRTAHRTLGPDGFEEQRLAMVDAVSPVFGDRVKPRGKAVGKGIDATGETPQIKGLVKLGMELGMPPEMLSGLTAAELRNIVGYKQRSKIALDQQDAELARMDRKKERDNKSFQVGLEEMAYKQGADVSNTFRPVRMQLDKLIKQSNNAPLGAQELFQFGNLVRGAEMQIRQAARAHLRKPNIETGAIVGESMTAEQRKQYEDTVVGQALGLYQDYLTNQHTGLLKLNGSMNEAVADGAVVRAQLKSPAVGQAQAIGKIVKDPAQASAILSGRVVGGDENLASRVTGAVSPTGIGGSDEGLLAIANANTILPNGAKGRPLNQVERVEAVSNGAGDKPELNRRAQTGPIATLETPGLRQDLYDNAFEGTYGEGNWTAAKDIVGGGPDSSSKMLNILDRTVTPKAIAAIKAYDQTTERDAILDTQKYYYRNLDDIARQASDDAKAAGERLEFDPATRTFSLGEDPGFEKKEFDNLFSAEGVTAVGENLVGQFGRLGRFFTETERSKNVAVLNQAVRSLDTFNKTIGVTPEENLEIQAMWLRKAGVISADQAAAVVGKETGKVSDGGGEGTGPLVRRETTRR